MYARPAAPSLACGRPWRRWRHAIHRAGARHGPPTLARPQLVPRPPRRTHLHTVLRCLECRQNWEFSPLHCAAPSGKATSGGRRPSGDFSSSCPPVAMAASVSSLFEVKLPAGPQTQCCSCLRPLTRGTDQFAVCDNPGTAFEFSAWLGFIVPLRAVVCSACWASANNAPAHPMLSLQPWAPQALNQIESPQRGARRRRGSEAADRAADGCRAAGPADGSGARPAAVAGGRLTTPWRPRAVYAPLVILATLRSDR